MAALPILGISLILVRSAEAFFIVKMLGAAYLCWIGFKALSDARNGLPTAAEVEPAKRPRTLMKAFAEGFLTNALNPKVSMFYLAAFPQFTPRVFNIDPIDGANSSADKARLEERCGVGVRDA